MIMSEVRPEDGSERSISDDECGTLGARPCGALPPGLASQHVRLAKAKDPRRQHWSTATCVYP